MLRPGWRSRPEAAVVCLSVRAEHAEAALEAAKAEANQKNNAVEAPRRQP
jgi:hypothetical protein